MIRSTPRVLVFLIAALALCDAALAQTTRSNAFRAERWEGTMMFIGVQGQDYTFEGGSSARTSDAAGFGFAFNYNAGEHLSFGGESLWSSIDYRATIQPAAGNPGTAYTARGEMETSTLTFNATWNVLSGPFTPYLTGSVGSTYIDTNVPVGPPIDSCWVYPFWGYYCGTFTPTATYTSLNYGVGAGLRWDFSRQHFARFGVQRQWMDFESSVSNYDGVNIWRLELGFKN